MGGGGGEGEGGMLEVRFDRHINEPIKIKKGNFKKV